MSKEAMKLALEALENRFKEKNIEWGQKDNAITALREALAQERSSDEQPAQQEPINDGWQITFANGHSGFGVYAHMDEYPEEGSRLLCAVPQWAKDALKATTTPPCPTCEALARTVMMDQTGRDA